MAEWGFGAPSDLSVIAGTAFDWGFGSPSPAAWTADQADTGFGSPLVIIGAAVVEPSDGLVPDDGGVFVRLFSGAWPIPGPYQIRLLDSGGGVHPNDRDCHSGRLLNYRTRALGTGRELYVDGAGERLSFVAPPVVPGVYSIRIQWAGSNEVVLVDALTVQVRNRAPSVYRMRNLLPPEYRPGARRMFDEPTANAVTDFPKGPLAAILDAVGQGWHEVMGAPSTRLTAALAPTDTHTDVETTLAFPDSGSLWCGPYRLTYTSKTATTFVGVTCSMARFMTVSAGQEVSLDARALLAP